MAQRSAHGSQAQAGRLTVSECTPADELPAAAGCVETATKRNAFGQFVKGNRSGVHNRGRVVGNSALARLDVAQDPAWQSARRWAKTASRHRISELAKMHGGELSSGVCRLLRAAARAAADAEYLARRAANKDDLDILRLSAQLDASARQAERDAWELASREAAARPKIGAQGLASMLAAPQPGRAKLPPAPPLTPGGGVELGPPPTPTASPIEHPDPNCPSGHVYELSDGSRLVPVVRQPNEVVHKLATSGDPFGTARSRCPEVWPGSGRQCVRPAGHAEPHDDGTGGR